ncbi:MAG: GNAT family N-acetyltransferase [Eubacteriales bacterium]
MIEGKWIFGKDNFDEIYNIRKKVFIDDLGLSENTHFDEYDSRAMHVLLLDDDKPVATGRVYEYNGTFTIGGIAVLPEARGNNIGDLLVRMLLQMAFNLLAEEVYVYARKESVDFYKKLNFADCGKTHEMEPGDERIVMKVVKETSPLSHSCTSCGKCGH